MKKAAATTSVASLSASKPSHYWADWDATTFAPHILRRDTRIYWGPQTLGTGGKCVGTFFGENPGGGRPSAGVNFMGYNPIEETNGQPGDKTLRLVLEIWRTAKSTHSNAPRPDDYIEVLNLYYFRDPVSQSAISSWRQLRGVGAYNPVVSATSKFVLLGWGKGMHGSPEAKASMRMLKNHSNIIIPNSNGGASTWTGSANLPSFPAMPSYFNRYSATKRPRYIQTVAALI